MAFWMAAVESVFAVGSAPIVVTSTTPSSSAHGSGPGRCLRTRSLGAAPAFKVICLTVPCPSTLSMRLSLVAGT